jgi:Calx-beta domain
MTLVPRFRMSPLMRQKTRRSSFFSLSGSMSRFGLIALLGLLSLSSSALAQDDEPKTEIQAYTIVATPDGSSLCRDATPREIEKMANAPQSLENLRRINHLEALQMGTNSESPNVDNPNLPGLKIFLMATDRLNANPTAKAAFIKAAKNWEDIIKTPMTIYIRVDVGPDFFGDTTDPYDADTIGSTGSALAQINYSQVRSALIRTASNANETALYNLLPNLGTIPTDSGDLGTMWVSLSLARAVGLYPANASSTDLNSMPQIGFNSIFNFDYDQSDGINPSLVDFTAVATHEIGHALGFSSTSGETGTLRPAILDLFRFRPGVTDFTNTPRIMTIGGGSQIFFAGAANIFTPPGTSEAGLSTGGPNGSTANGGDGRQSSHWRDDTRALGGIHYGIMDPSIANGRLEVITTNDLIAFNYLGYNIDTGGVVTPQTPTLQISQSSYSIAEGTGSLDLLVNRSGDSTLPVTVNYATSDAAVFLQNCNVTNGAATSRCDYVGILGTLHFAAGETSKNISIPIIDDTYGEGAETFSISLSNPSGSAVLGANQRATITVTDNGNDGAGQPTSIDNPTFFVRQHYIDFLSREPDPLSAGWVTILNGCGAGDQSCRLMVSQGIYNSPEFRDRGYFIYKFYSVSLGRKPTYDEFNVDRARVSGFQTEAELEQSKVDFIADFMSRSGFTSIYSGLSNNAYVQRLFDTAGVTQVTVNGQGVQSVAGMQQLLAGGRSRAQVLRDIAESPEVSARFNTESTVVMHYFGYLRRDPDAAYQGWINILNSTGDSRNVTSGFINSPEYRSRFGQ